MPYGASLPNPGRTFVVECRVVTDLGEECAMALGTFITRRRTDQDAEREEKGLPR